MSSLPRKTGSNSTGGLAAVAQQRASAALAASKQQGSLPSSQYLDAINVLSEATILEACALALSEKDYQDDHDIGEKSDYSKLLEIEKKCRQAAKVVHKEAIPAPSAMVPPSMPTIPASRVNTAVKKSATGKTMAGNAPKTLLGKSITPSVVPIRRGSLAGSRPAILQGKRVMAQQLQRAESDESSIGSERSGNVVSNKKARLGAAAGGPSEGQVGGAPPPSALDFLKKLNQDKPPTTEGSSSKQPKNKGEQQPPKSKGESKPSSNKEKEKVSNDTNSDAESNTSETNSPPQREGTRKNPSRGVRR